MSSSLFLFLSIFSLWSGLGYASTLNSYFFVFVCHYSLRITSRAEYIHTNASSFFWSRSVVVLISLSLCFERAIEHLSLKKKEVSIEEKRGTSLSFTSSSRLPDPWGEISQSSVFSLKISLDETTVVYEYAPRGGTPTLFFNEKTQSIILSRGQSVLSLAIEKKKRLFSLRNPFLPTLTTTTTKKERRD